MQTEPFIKTTVEPNSTIICDNCDTTLHAGETFYAVKHTGNYCSVPCMENK